VDASPTAVLAFIESPAPATPTLDLPTATPLPDPLRFVFPTPRPAPVSAWRPPLYPVPWAPTPYDHFYLARPIAPDQISWPLQDYRYGGDFFADTIHTGVDIPAPMRTPVLAAGPGKVIEAGYGLYRGGEDVTDPYGIAVAIQHDFGYQNQKIFTLYGHLDETIVQEGQWVDTGQVIGYVGQTGRVTGPHLHFEVRLGENSYYSTRNPELWIVPPEGWGVLVGRVMNSNAELIEKQPVLLTSQETTQIWRSRSYGSGAVNRDPYYKENLVIGDIPAGRYMIQIAYAGKNLSQELEIVGGRVTYIYFYGTTGFALGDPKPVLFSP
jgi:murein DD-endopeptidase MepM/ murein hydrolase activator NlpD